MSRFTHPYKLGASKRLVFLHLVLTEEELDQISCGTIYKNMKKEDQDRIDQIASELGEDSSYITVIRRAIDELAKDGYILREKLGTEKSLGIDGGNSSGTVYNLAINEEAKGDFFEFHQPRTEDPKLFVETEDSDVQDMYDLGGQENAFLGHILRCMVHDTITQNMKSMTEKLRQNLRGSTNGEFNEIKDQLTKLETKVDFICMSPLFQLRSLSTEEEDNEQHI